MISAWFSRRRMISSFLLLAAVNTLSLFVYGQFCCLYLVNEILDVIINGFIAMFPKKRMWSHDFEDDNTYGKVVAILNQIIYMVYFWNLGISIRVITVTLILLLLETVLRWSRLSKLLCISRFMDLCLLNKMEPSIL